MTYLKSKIAALAGLIVIAGLGWLYLGQSQGQETAQRSTVKVTTGTVRETVLATGLIEAQNLVSVGARTSGQIEALNVQVGDDVAAGDTIAQIDSLEQQNAVAQAKADLAQLNAEIVAQNAEIRQAQLDLTRQEGLNEKRLSATSDLETAQAALSVAQAQLVSLDAQKSRAQIEVSSAELDLDRTKITAPIDGTVVAVVNGEGTTVNAAQDAPTIVKLAQLNEMQVKAEISEADVIHVAPGQAVSFSLLGAPDMAFDAVLDRIEPAPSSIKDDDEIDTDSAIYYNARFSVDNPDRLLRIGMSADVTITLNLAENVPVLPLSALPKAGPDGRMMVLVASGDGVQRRFIEIGLRDATQAQILSGLSAGDDVIVDSSPSAAPSGTPPTNIKRSGGTGGGRGSPPPMMGL
ncbi:efflux RND transporter periplasmic adaptor subunit [Thioclava sp. SK-1]|uniref:efflux RND transporter periplasmic adaptor subunit n=1 Tax=Thioclava sp. SK-1 TaxID=1889770 RepID=UPI000AA8E0C5|nr:efflux RND transporter periplasmic adaptor subunit [Thioclava sp. SK-1]